MDTAGMDRMDLLQKPKPAEPNNYSVKVELRLAKDLVGCVVNFEDGAPASVTFPNDVTLSRAEILLASRVIEQYTGPSSSMQQVMPSPQMAYGGMLQGRNVNGPFWF